MKTGPRGRTGEERRRPADPAGSDGRAEPAVRTQRSDRLCIILYIYIYYIIYTDYLFYIRVWTAGQTQFRVSSESFRTCRVVAESFPSHFATPSQCRVVSESFRNCRFNAASAFPSRFRVVLETPSRCRVVAESFPLLRRGVAAISPRQYWSNIDSILVKYF